MSSAITPLLILIPGLQGRHEWLGPTIEALAPHFDVASFSLNEDAGQPDVFGAWARHIDGLLDARGVDAAVVAGHSFGGLVAMHYAAVCPDRVRALVLASAPSPTMPLDSRQELYVRFPYLTLPLFAAHATARLAPEMLAARPTWAGRLGVAAAQLRRALRAPIPPGHMAAWVRAWKARRLADDCARVTAPTLVLTGEKSLDRVVPVGSSREYLTLIPGARHVVVPGTGHLGLVTRPDAWSAAVVAFVQDCAAGSVAGDNRAMHEGGEDTGARHD